jgi:hypothetical protein
MQQDDAGVEDACHTNSRRDVIRTKGEGEGKWTPRHPRRFSPDHRQILFILGSVNYRVSKIRMCKTRLGRRDYYIYIIRQWNHRRASPRRGWDLQWQQEQAATGRASATKVQSSQFRRLTGRWSGGDEY